MLSTYVKQKKSAESVQEKILYFGANTLSDSELLSLFINGSIKENEKIKLARTALKERRSLNGLVHADMKSFCSTKGLGIKSLCMFHAAIELDRRRVFTESTSSNVLSSPQQVREFATRMLSGRLQEVFTVILLDNRHRVHSYHELFVGTLDLCAVHVVDVAKLVLNHPVAACLFVHQHPSGVAEPSETDVRLTKRLSDALALIDVRVLDHLVIGEGVSTSLAERGLM